MSGGLGKNGATMAENVKLAQKTQKKCQFICLNGGKALLLQPLRQNSLVENPSLIHPEMTNNGLIIGIINLLLHTAVGSDKVRR